MKVIAVINQKGGVSKTTTALALFSIFNNRGLKTLVVDLDAQANLSFAIGADTAGKTSYDVITGKCTALEALQHMADGDVIAAGSALSAADTLLTKTGKEYRLREAFDALRDEYDFIVLDTPPSLGILLVNALTAADEAIVPAQADVFSIQGIDQLADTVSAVKKYCNPALKLSGILITRYNGRAILSRDMAALMEKMAERLGTRLFKAKIREAVAVKEAQAQQKSLAAYSPKSKPAADYQAFADELLEVSNVS